MEKSRSLRTKKEMWASEPPQDFNELLDGLKNIAETGVKVVEILNDFTNIKDTLEAQDILENKEVKSFGTYGAHIILPAKFIGMNARVIIKKKKNNNHNKK